MKSLLKILTTRGYTPHFVSSFGGAVELKKYRIAKEYGIYYLAKTSEGQIFKGTLAEMKSFIKTYEF